MNAQVDSIIDALADDLVHAVRQAIRFPSVREPDAGPGAPFGNDIRRCLEHVLALAEGMGFHTKNLDGYVGIADYDGGCGETLGILCHLDVVPAGGGWIHDPFGAALEDGVIYGRGALDDKGPSLASLYALLAVKRAGIPLRRNVRILFGCDEETSWQCVERFKKTEPLPDLAISPDAKYPLLWSEKNVLQASYAKSFPSRVTVRAGIKPNVVPDEAAAHVPLSLEEVKSAAALAEAETGCTLSLAAEGKGTRILARGASSHANTPGNGKNAALALLSLLAKLPLGPDGELARTLHERFGNDLTGQKIGVDREDETGRTTMNLGILHWNEAGIRQMTLDLRFPRSLTIENAQQALDRALTPLGFALSGTYVKGNHFVPRESELVTTLLDVYERRAGERLPPIAGGSITYARALPHAVAFGCGRPGRPECIHMPGEHISIEDLLFDARMIADAILALACTSHQE